MQITQNPDLEFIAAFNTQPEGMVKAPGRVNLIGEHTDYNNGFVLPFALDLSTITAFRVRDDSKVRVRSLKYPDYMDTFSTTEKFKPCEQQWANYVRGVFSVIKGYGFQLKHGLDLLITSDIPLDAGLASSAALSVSVAGAITKGLNLPLDKRSLALIAQKAENEFLGKKCGIMDQLTATSARIGNLLLIDCEDFEVEHIPLPAELSIVIFNSCVKIAAVEHEYNARRSECAQAASIMNVTSLRHATLDILKMHKGDMTDTCFRRARHVITENERTKRVANALLESDINLVFKLMFESHESMKNDFQITIPEIDTLVSFCKTALNGKVGARMTGGGFGGSVIALCRNEHAKSLIKTVSQQYHKRFNLIPKTHIARPGNGMRIQRCS
jgi:galactokinase